MKRIISFTLIAVFSIFLGSQITEGCLLIPYWKSLSKTEFYEYYTEFGPVIGKFYSILTIIAVLIPAITSINCFVKKSTAFKFAIISTIFAFLVLVLYFCFFKDINQKFYNSHFDLYQLQAALDSWENWHWLRVLFEFISLIFLILTFSSIKQKA